MFTKTQNSILCSLGVKSISRTTDWMYVIEKTSYWSQDAHVDMSFNWKSEQVLLCASRHPDNVTPQVLSVTWYCEVHSQHMIDQPTVQVTEHSKMKCTNQSMYVISLPKWLYTVSLTSLIIYSGATARASINSQIKASNAQMISL